MASTLVRNVFDGLGNIVMIVKPDDDAQLKDPAFSPPNTFPVDVARTDYDAVVTTKDYLTLVLPGLNAQNRICGLVCEGKIEAIDVSESVAADVQLAKEKVQQAIDAGVIAAPVVSDTISQ